MLHDKHYYNVYGQQCLEQCPSYTPTTAYYNLIILQQNCESLGGYLACIGSDEEFSAIRQIVPERGMYAIIRTRHALNFYRELVTERSWLVNKKGILMDCSRKQETLKKFT